MKNEEKLTEGKDNDIKANEDNSCKRPSNKKKIITGIALVVAALVIGILVFLERDTKKLVELGDWVRFDEGRNMPLDLAFDSRTNEFYYCEDSEPYMGYDVYEKYKFVSSRIIKLYSKYHKNKEYAMVISVNTDELVIKIGDDINKFTNQAANYDDTKPFDYSSCDKCKKVINGGVVGMDIRRVDGDNIHVAKGGDETKLYDYKITKDAKIYDIYVDEKYDENGETIHKCDIKEISRKDIEGLIKVVYPYGLIWFNTAEEIEKLVVFRVSSDYKVSDM